MVEREICCGINPFYRRVVTDNPDLERAARSVVDENGVWLYHDNIGPTENGFWVEAKDLREGDVFLGANGELSTLVAMERVEFPNGIKVYNFTVDGNHDYFVIAKDDPFGQTCILVHNAKCGKSKPVWDANSTTPIRKLLKGSGQIPAFERKGIPGHDITKLLSKSPQQIVQDVNDGKISKNVFRTIRKFFEGRELRHGN